MTEVYWVAAFEGTAAAIAAEKSAREAGQNARLIALPPEISAGCGFALRIEQGSVDRTLEVLFSRHKGEFSLHKVKQEGLKRTIIIEGDEGHDGCERNEEGCLRGD